MLKNGYETRSQLAASSQVASDNCNLIESETQVRHFTPSSINITKISSNQNSSQQSTQIAIEARDSSTLFSLNQACSKSFTQLSRNSIKKLPYESDNSDSDMPAIQEKNVVIEKKPALTLDEILEFGKKGIFPKRIFIFGKKKKEKTPVTHFYKVKTEYSEYPSENKRINFECIICQAIKIAPFKDLSNLIKHLRSHDEATSWVKSFCSTIGRSSPTILSEGEFDLATYFITCNVGLTHLSNPSFKKLLDKSIKCPSYHIFRNKVIQIYIYNN